MSEGTTTGGGYGESAPRNAVTQGPGELDGSETGSTLASANGPETSADAMNIQARVTLTDDYGQAVALQAQSLELNRRSIEAYERLAERAAASNERVAAALETIVAMLQKAWDEDKASGF